MLIQELKLQDYNYKSRRGLAERIAKNYFLKKGYEVFRSVMILGKEFSINYNLYENVKKKYERLDEIILKNPKLKIIKTRKGLPDYLVCKNKTLFFVEVKLEHEQIKKHQLECMRILEELNFKVIVLRIKSKPFRLKCLVDLKRNGSLNLSNKTILEQQKKLKLKWIRIKNNPDKHVQPN